MKKLLATILALVMAIGVTTTAWADGEGTTAKIAEIGETGYATLADAIAAAQAGETIVLLADAAINSNTQITRNVAIDLNGKTVTVTTVGTQNAFEVQNGATFRLGNITVALQVTGAGAYHVAAETVRNLRAFVVYPPPGI